MRAVCAILTTGTVDVRYQVRGDVARTGVMTRPQFGSHRPETMARRLNRYRCRVPLGEGFGPPPIMGHGATDGALPKDAMATSFGEIQGSSPCCPTNTSRERGARLLVPKPRRGLAYNPESPFQQSRLPLGGTEAASGSSERSRSPTPRHRIAREGFGRAVAPPDASGGAFLMPHGGSR